MSLNKGEYGYIKKYKQRKLINTLVILIAALAIYFIGYFLNNRSNKSIFTVISILLMLPMARVCVALIIALPFKGMQADDHEFIDKKKGNGIILYDLIVTSSEKVMNIDSIYIADTQVMLLITNKKQDKEYIKDYMEKYLKGRLYDRKVNLCQDKNNYSKIICNVDNEKQKENEAISKEILILNI